MNKTPITWTKGTWDYKDKESMGYDAIPTIYDADASGNIAYRSGIGSGSDLYVSDLVPSGTTLYEDIIAPSGDMWVPKVDTGYLYLGRNEYYLYSTKGTTIDTPTAGVLDLITSSDMYPSYLAPIIVTLGASEFGLDSPFGKTYEYGRTSSKYRRRADLSDRKEYYASGTIADGIVPLPYTFTLGSMEYILDGPNEWSIRCYPSGSSVTVEYELGEVYYMATDVDMNIYNSYEVSNSFIVVVDEDTLVPSTVELVNASRYTRKSKPMLLIAAVKDSNGIPISGALVEFISDYGSFSDDEVYTIWDGTASTWFTTSTVNIEVPIWAVCGTATGTIWIPGGKIS